jgi:Flp pilus assembly protein TadD
VIEVLITVSLLSIAQVAPPTVSPAVAPMVSPAVATAVSPAVPPSVSPTVAPSAVARTRAVESDDLRSALEQVKKLNSAGKQSAALSILQAARRRHSKSAELHWMLGVLQRTSHQMRHAELSFTRAVELDPKHVHARADLAMVLERRGAYAEALTSINRAASLAPSDPGIRADRAIIRYQLGQFDAAVNDMERAAKILKDDPDLALNHGLMLLARGKKGDFDQALKVLRRAQRYAPDSPLVQLAYAQANLAAKRDQAALAAYDRILDKNPKQAWANWGRGLVAFRSKDFDAARIYGTAARESAAASFTLAVHNRRNFFSSDAKAYLRWLDEHVTKTSAKPPALAMRKAPSLTRLIIAGGCRRAPTKARLNTERGRISKCFGSHLGTIDVRVSLTEGAVSEAEQTGGGVTKGVDLCVLKVMEKASYPPKATCTIRVSWERKESSGALKTPKNMRVPTQPKTLPGR